MLQPAKYWREIPQRYRLEAGKCTGCGRLFFPPRVVCDRCKGRTFEIVNLPREGTLVSYTVIHTPAKNFSDEAPFAVGVVELAPGVKITSQMVDHKAEELKVGKKVRLEFRKIQKDGESGILCYGYKAVPAV